MAEIISVDESAFSTQAGNGLVLVDFYADWCGPCKMLHPILEEAAKEASGKAKFIKVNVDEAQNLAMQYSVTSIPTVVLLKDGQEVDRFIGVRDKESVLAMIASH